ncbi:hypothetical protein RhiirB3_434822 [Rhizophagus irregularis]|nr:hypothetical protein RhiirB3_434822 [Rhizophagus irregularis]
MWQLCKLMTEGIGGSQRVKKLVYIYRNLQLYEKGLKRKLIHDQCNDNNNNDINNNNNNTGNNNNNDDDDRIFGLKLNIMDLTRNYNWVN